MRASLGTRLGGLVGWPALGWCWWLVIRDGDAPTPTMVAAPVVLAVVTLVVTMWWVRHNLAIHRRKGPRRSVPVAAFPYLTDRRGRPLHLDHGALRSAREVVVGIAADGAKHYRAAP